MKYVHIAVVSVFLSDFSVAGTMGVQERSDSWNFVGSVSLGPVWENAGQTQTLYLTPDIVKTYVANDITNTLFDGEIFLGMQKNLPTDTLGQIGLAVAATSNAAFSGVVWDDANSSFNNYTYRYQLQHTHLAVKGKLLSEKSDWLMPWISASIGVGFNSAHGFKNTPVIPEAVMMPNFSCHTETSFTYTLGAGLQKILNPHWQLGIGYEFADWGQSQLGRATGQTLNSGLVVNDLYTNGVLFNLTYIS